jgi:hypothetical protein
MGNGRSMIHDGAGIGRSMIHHAAGIGGIADHDAAGGPRRHPCDARHEPSWDFATDVTSSG